MTQPRDLGLDQRPNQHALDDVAGADDSIAWSTSSSFGNFVSDHNATERSRVRDRFGRKLDSLRHGAGIKLER